MGLIANHCASQLGRPVSGCCIVADPGQPRVILTGPRNGCLICHQFRDALGLEGNQHAHIGAEALDPGEDVLNRPAPVGLGFQLCVIIYFLRVTQNLGRSSPVSTNSPCQIFEAILVGTRADLHLRTLPVHCWPGWWVTVARGSSLR